VFISVLCVVVVCPNECNGHGNCVSMRDLALYSGLDYQHSETGTGDGLGPDYANWDRHSIQLCECDLGYFGSDCSQGLFCGPSF
jgi:hypothetical protein